MRPLVRQSRNTKAGKLFVKEFSATLKKVYGGDANYRELTNKLIYHTLRQGTVQALESVVVRDAAGRPTHPKHSYLSWEGRRWVIRRIAYVVKLGQKNLTVAEFESLYFKRFPLRHCEEEIEIFSELEKANRTTAARFEYLHWVAPIKSST